MGAYSVLWEAQAGPVVGPCSFPSLCEEKVWIRFLSFIAHMAESSHFSSFL